MKNKFFSIFALSVLTLLALSSCSTDEDSRSEKMDASLNDPQERLEAEQDHAKEIDPTPDSSENNTTGDYRADLRAVGFDPEERIFNSVISTLEESVCEFDSSSISSIAHEGMVTAMVQDANVGADAVRVIAEYNCPLEAELIEEIIQTATQ